MTGSPSAGDEDSIVETEAELDQHESFMERAIQAEMETGHREETVEKAKRSLVVRVATITAGSFLLLLGLVFFLIPGPGLLTIAAGLALLSIDVPFARRLLMRVRKRLPEGEDGKVKPHVIIISIVVSVIFIGFSVWFTIRALSN